MADQYYDRRIQSFAPLAAKVLAFILLVVGFFAVIGGFYLAIILVLAGAFMMLAYSGVQVDTNNKKYREYTGFLGLKFGKFHDMPPLSNIVVFNYSTRVENNLTMGGAQSFSSETSCRMSLKGQNKRFTLHCANGNKKAVMKDALLMSEIFLLDIVDITGKEKKVIKIQEADTVK